jgi:hypothetical protein
MSLSATVKAMAAAGCSAEQIADVVARIDDERREKAREGNRKRQAKWRHRNNGDNGVIPCDMALSGVTETPPSVSPKINNQTPSTPSPSSLRSESSETASPRRTRSKPSEKFLKFWQAYPTDPLMSRKDANAVFVKLSAEDQDAATASIPAFIAYCRADPTYRAVHANRFLSQRRFDGFGTALTGAGAETPREKAIRQLAEMKARDAENERHDNRNELFGNAGSALQEPARRSCDDPPEGFSPNDRGAGNLGNGGGKVVYLSDQPTLSQDSFVLESHDPGRVQSRGYGPLR